MPSERVQRQIDRLLDEAEQAIARSDWPLVQDRCHNVLALDPSNSDAQAYLTAAGRRLGGDATMAGEVAAAEAYVDQSLDVARSIRNRPEIALTRLQLAELLLDHHPERRAEAMDHLDFAIGEFRAMKMTPSLERALGRRGLVGGEGRRRWGCSGGGTSE